MKKLKKIKEKTISKKINGKKQNKVVKNLKQFFEIKFRTQNVFF